MIMYFGHNKKPYGSTTDPESYINMSLYKVQGSLLFVTYTIIQGIISSEM